jgi:hypothetical protein
MGKRIEEQAALQGGGLRIHEVGYNIICGPDFNDSCNISRNLPIASSPEYGIVTTVYHSRRGQCSIPGLLAY